VLTAKISTKGQLVLPRQLRERNKVRAGDIFELVEGDAPDVIILRKISPSPNEGLVDALLASPHRFKLPARRREYPKKPKL
jgi:AbrB family looped-hinge helix DNA binding protein